jgi:hypothetical protein
MVFLDTEWMRAAIVKAAPEAVFQGIAALKQEEVRGLGENYGDALAIDEGHRTITLTGHWWYQGVHTISPCPNGSRVTYRVRNIAQVARTLAFLHRPFYVRQMRQEFEHLLHQLGSQLGCSWVLEKAP